MKRLFFLSYAVAAFTFALPPVLFYLGNKGWFTLLYPESVIFSGDVLLIVWLAIFGVAFYKYRWRSVWLVIGAPLALLWPVWLGAVLWSCFSGGACL